MIDIQPVWKRYAAAMACVAVALALRFALMPWIGIHMAFWTFYTAVIIVAWFGGFGPTVMASLLGFACAEWLMQHYAEHPPQFPSSVRFTTFSIVGLTVAVLSGLLHRERRKAANAASQAIRQHAELQHEVNARLESERRFETFMDNSPAIALIKDSHGRFVYVSRRYCEFFGKDPAWFLDKTVFDRYPRELAERLDAQDTEVRKTGKTREHVDEVPTPDGVKRSWLTSKFLFQSADGMMLGMVGVEITPRIKAERALQEAHCELGRRVHERTTELAQAVAKLELEIAEKRRVEADLRQEREFIRLVLDTNPNFVYVTTRDSKFVLVNDTIARRFGIPASELIGVEASQIVRSPEELERFVATTRRVLETGQTIVVDEKYTTLDGEVLWLNITKTPLRMPDGTVHVLAIANDITERKRVEEDLQHEREFIRLALDTNPSFIFVVSADHRIVLANEAMARLFGMSVHEIVGTDTSQLVSCKEEFGRYVEATRRVLETGQTVVVDDAFTTAEGRVIWLHIIKTPLRMPDGTVHVLAIETDITERRRAEQDLQHEREFLVNTLGAHERDRKLISYEIHDGIVQHLTGTIFRLEGLRAKAPFASEDDREWFDSAIIMLRRAINESRRLMGSLRPLVIDEAGVGTALEYLVAEHRQKGDLDVAFENRTNLGRLDPLLENTVFRIAQEALANAARHSGTQQAKLVLSQDNGTIRLEISDEGRGFDTSTVAPGRFGIEGIRKRASVVRGSARIEAVPGGGTRVLVELPIGERFENATTT